MLEKEIGFSKRAIQESSFGELGQEEIYRITEIFNLHQDPDGTIAFENTSKFLSAISGTDILQEEAKALSMKLGTIRLETFLNWYG